MVHNQPNKPGLPSHKHDSMYAYSTSNSIVIPAYADFSRKIDTGKQECNTITYSHEGHVQDQTKSFANKNEQICT
jgi:hypothetical protein